MLDIENGIYSRKDDAESGTSDISLTIIEDLIKLRVYH
jgi:hypothetical protein